MRYSVPGVCLHRAWQGTEMVVVGGTGEAAQVSRGSYGLDDWNGFVRLWAPAAGRCLAGQRLALAQFGAGALPGCGGVC